MVVSFSINQATDIHKGFIGGSGFYKDGMGHMMNVPVAAFDPIFYVHHW